MSRLAPIGVVIAVALLAGCDMIGGALGIESPEKVAAARDADGRAIGGACRHAGRAIEDCYTLNKKADKSAIFAGWRDMNDYMRENKIETVAPQLTAQLAGAPSGGGSSRSADADDARTGPTSERPAPKAAEAARPKTREASKTHDS